MDELLEALELSLEARERERRAREKHHGYDWDYFGRYEIQAKEAAEKRLKQVFKEVVREAMLNLQLENLKSFLDTLEKSKTY